MTTSEARRLPDAGSREPEPSLTLDLHEALPDEIQLGLGQFLVVSGECRSPDCGIDAVMIEVDEAVLGAELSRIPGGVGFWQAVFLSADLVGRTVRVRAEVSLSSGRVVARKLGEVACRDVEWQPATAPGPRSGNSLIAICMATYEPELEAFQRQVDSIRGQSYTDWVCIINDDGSSNETWAKMQKSCSTDDRFRFYQNPGNLGFYRNFESALKKVPSNADYVAFSDQDDYWYENKLAALVDGMRRDDVNLVYSDMRIVDADGTEVAATYWVNRRNEHRDLPVVLVANTVTGAASMFKRELLQHLVPFPPRVGDAFHDHWLACSALSTGTVGYIDAPLYDYYQYGDSVIGHCDFVRFTLRQRLASLVRLCLRLCRPSVAGPLLRGKYASALAIYRGECRRLRIVQETIRRRCPVEPSRTRELRLFDGGIGSVVKLLALHARVLVKGQTTDDAELRLAMGEIARIVERRRG